MPSRTPWGLVTSSPNSSSAPAREWWTYRPSWQRQGKAARQRRREQERPQRRPLCRRGCPAGKALVGGHKRGPRRSDRRWARRRKDLTSARTRVANRLHAVILELVPGGYAGEIYASKVERLLEAFGPAGAVAAARKELAEELLGDLRRLDGQLAELPGSAWLPSWRRRGPPRPNLRRRAGRGRHHRRPHPRRGPLRRQGPFCRLQRLRPDRGLLGQKEIYRLSMRGCRELNHALHMAAVTQVRHRHSQGRAYYDKKVAEGKTGKEALRALKRRISDALFAAMADDATGAEKELSAGGPGGQTGNGSVASAAGSRPAKPALRPSHSRAKPKARPSRPATRCSSLRESQRKISKAS